MPKCSNCNNVQAKLNKRKLCKKCHNNYNDQNKGIDLKEDQLDESINMQLPNDRSIIDLIKENMEQEKKWNVEVISMLRDQIDYLKNDIIHKNTLIEQLICNENKSNNTIPSLPSADADNNILECSNISTPCANSVSTNGTNISTSNNNSYTSDDVKIKNTPDDINWKEVRNKRQKSKLKRNSEMKFNVPLENYYRTLIVDTESDFETEFTNHVPAHIHHRNPLTYQENIKRPNPVINNKQENDKIVYNNPKHIPGNSSYANIATSGKKVLLLSDSICSRIKMKEFNRELKNGRAYRKQFPGATSKEMAHYVIPTLAKDSPDTVIIHTGTNDLRNTENEHIIKNIMDIVDLCAKQGVNNILVSAITFREQFNEKVSTINNFLLHKQTLHNFTFIENNNITREHMWKDKIHLNTHGTINIANNFINALNKGLSD